MLPAYHTLPFRSSRTLGWFLVSFTRLESDKLIEPQAKDSSFEKPDGIKWRIFRCSEHWLISLVHLDNQMREGTVGLGLVSFGLYGLYGGGSHIFGSSSTCMRLQGKAMMRSSSSSAGMGAIGICP